MFRRVRQFLRGSSRLLEAEARLVRTRLRQLGLFVALGVALGVLGALAVAGAAAGAAVLLAPAVGLGIALLVVSGALLLAVALTFWLVNHRLAAYERSERPPEAAVRDAKGQLEEAIGPSGDGQAPAGAPAPGLEFAQHAIDRMRSHPAATAGAVFAVTSVLGVRRSVRIARAAAGLISTGVVAYRALSKLDGEMPREPSPPETPEQESIERPAPRTREP
jgi:hypothetical protein